MDTDLLRAIIGVLIALCMGSVCAKQAKRKGRNPTVWFFIGALFGLMGLLILFFQSPIEKEQLPPPRPLPSKEDRYKQKLWYYLDKQDQQIGPMSYSVLESSFLEEKINSETLVWNEDFDDWKEIKSLELFRELLTTS